MWEEIYCHFAKKKQQYSDNISLEIAEYCDQANHASELTIPHQKEIESVLGNGSRIILIHYGLNEDEIKSNINKILQLESFLQEDDELIVDITHSFRSLPLIIMNLLIYIQMVCSKNIRILHIHYGMLEVNRELNYTPIIDLAYMLNIIQWISGASSFAQFGNAYQIAALLEEENKSVSKRLIRFSDAFNFNFLYGIKECSRLLLSIKNETYETNLPRLILNPIIEDFQKKVSTNQITPNASFQFKIAEWQYEHKNYGFAYITLTESIITYICEKNQKSPFEKINRDLIKNDLNGRKQNGKLRYETILQEYYKKINKYRNHIAHQVNSQESIDDLKLTLQVAINTLRSIIR